MFKAPQAIPMGNLKLIITVLTECERIYNSIVMGIGQTTPRIFHLVLDNTFYKMEPIQSSVTKMVRGLEVMLTMP